MQDILKQIFSFKRSSGLRAKSSVDPKGAPRIIVRDAEGNVISDFQDANLVVNVGRNSLIRMLTGDYTGRVAKIELGKGGVVGDPWTPVTPSVLDVNLTAPLSPVVSKNISGFVYAEGLNPTSVEFSVIFEAYEVNDIISEAALRLLDGKMYARYTFPSVYLKADKGYSMEIIWTIKFS